MRMGVIGAGYVGLVTGTCLAEMGNEVTIVDIAEEKIATLRQGKAPHYEPGLEEILVRNLNEGRLAFSTVIADAVRQSHAIFIAVGTPMAENGAADLSAVEASCQTIAKAMDGYRAIIIKSTVPVGTNRRIASLVASCTPHPFDVISNPEFLKEGAAVEDFMRPDRVVVGVRTEAAAMLMRQIYDPFVRTGRPILIVDPESAEMIKYASNALLASRISFMNEMAAICSKVGADVEAVRKGVGADYRIGPAFLFPGLGYGGSCFPKDVRALIHLARQAGVEARMCEAIDAVNRQQYLALFPAIEKEFGTDLHHRHFALWGLAFKPRTDDVREAPALYLAKALVERGATITAFDPVAMETARKAVGDLIHYAPSRDAALEGADALLIATEWNEFRSPDFEKIARILRRPLIFDGRNLYDPEVLRRAGFTYYSIGRPPVVGTPR